MQNKKNALKKELYNNSRIYHRKAKTYIKINRSHPIIFWGKSEMVPILSVGKYVPFEPVS